MKYHLCFCECGSGHSGLTYPKEVTNSGGPLSQLCVGGCLRLENDGNDVTGSASALSSSTKSSLCQRKLLIWRGQTLPCPSDATGNLQQKGSFHTSCTSLSSPEMHGNKDRHNQSIQTCSEDSEVILTRLNVLTDIHFFFVLFFF